MPPIKTLVATAIAGLLLAACQSTDGTSISPQQREALTEDMLEPDSFGSGFIPGPGPIRP